MSANLPTNKLLSKIKLVFLLLGILIITAIVFAAIFKFNFNLLKLQKNPQSTESVKLSTTSVKTYGVVIGIDKEMKTLEITDSQTGKKYKVKVSPETKLIQGNKEVGFDLVTNTSVTVISRQSLEESKENQAEEIWIAPTPKPL